VSAAAENEQSSKPPVPAATAGVANPQQHQPGYTTQASVKASGESMRARVEENAVVAPQELTLAQQPASAEAAAATDADAACIAARAMAESSATESLTLQDAPASSVTEALAYVSSIADKVEAAAAAASEGLQQMSTLKPAGLAPEPAAPKKGSGERAAGADAATAPAAEPVKHKPGALVSEAYASDDPMSASSDEPATGANNRSTAAAATAVVLSEEQNESSAEPKAGTEELPVVQVCSMEGPSTTVTPPAQQEGQDEPVQAVSRPSEEDNLPQVGSIACEHQQMRKMC
jgi:hypothetical protein